MLICQFPRHWQAWSYFQTPYGAETSATLFRRFIRDLVLTQTLRRASSLRTRPLRETTDSGGLSVRQPDFPVRC